MKLLFAGVFMECLKYHWALNINKLRTNERAGIVTDSLKSDRERYSFAELLEMVATDLKTRHACTFIENRNAIFHTGKNSDGWTVLEPELIRLHDQIDDLLLAICRYSGTFAPYWEADKRLKFRGRGAAE